MTDHDSQTATRQIQAAIVAALNLQTFAPAAHTEAQYLRAALEDGFDVADLATAHEVSKRTIYRHLDRHGIDYDQPPSNGPARQLWNAHPDAVPSDD
ncbi:hypothetical protein GOC74_00145 [Halomicrobium mukohataei]|uniref:Uncharacterized protein n=1 Tax=Halomicrobium mukohataei TaxID=57705 RepID=A0A847U6X2_9EURY|nr:hypothetical protein [Halomicrobium mukohataei]NLV08356.1 hypothetical protein [Halomicrobium mukohataei]